MKVQTLRCRRGLEGKAAQPAGLEFEGHQAERRRNNIGLKMIGHSGEPGYKRTIEIIVYRNLGVYVWYYDASVPCFQLALRGLQEIND